MSSSFASASQPHSGTAWPRCPLAALAASVGDTVRVQSVTAPNLAVIDHVLGATNAAAVVRQGGWKFVVLQQGGWRAAGALDASIALYGGDGFHPSPRASCNAPPTKPSRLSSSPHNRAAARK